MKPNKDKKKSLEAFIFMLFAFSIEYDPKFTNFMAHQAINAGRGLQ